jgi:predicted nucleic acid-binding protein
MRVVADSSAFAKRYVREPGSDQLNDLLARATELGVCIILIPEIFSALNRLLRENRISNEAYQHIKQQFLTDINDAIILQTTPETVASAIELLETNTLRAMDALHIAAAILWQADLFVTADKRQWLAARHAGIETILLGDENTTL